MRRTVGPSQHPNNRFSEGCAAFAFEVVGVAGAKKREAEVDCLP